MRHSEMFYSVLVRLLIGAFFLTMLSELALCSDTGGDVRLVPGLSHNVLSDLRRTRVNQPLTFLVRGNDLDSASAITVTQQPSNGTLTVNGRQLTFTPVNDVSSPSEGKIKVEWPDGKSDSASIDLRIEQVGKETYFDRENGDNSNPGTAVKPKKTGVQSAISRAKPGDRIYLKGGQVYDSKITVQKIGGTLGAPIVLSSYGGNRAQIRPSSGPAMVFGKSIGSFVIENIDIVGNSESAAVRAYNQPDDSMGIIFDHVDITGAGSQGINWQDRGGGSVTLVRCNIHDNAGVGFLGGSESTIVLNSIFSRNHNTKDYEGGAMHWNLYIGKGSISIHIEGNLFEDSEGLVKLRAAKDFIMQKNTLRRGWVVGLGAGGQVGRALEDGLIANNLIVDSGNALHLGDSDGRAGAGIKNVDVRNNVVVGGHISAGFTNGGTFSVSDKGDTNTNFRVFDNIFWANQSLGFGGARLDHNDVAFFNNIVGGGHESEGWLNYVLRLKDRTPEVRNNTLYKFHTNTDLGIPLRNGNKETTTIPKEVQYILNRL